MNKYLLLVLVFSMNHLAVAGYYDGWTEEQLATLKDPKTRDESIADTIVDVKVEIQADGNYLYRYNVVSPISNKGTIAGLRVDISCDVPSKEPLGYSEPNTYSDDGKHIIIGSRHPDYPDVQPPAVITPSNYSKWGFILKPGETKSDLILTSAEAPVYRQYELNVSMSTYGWDYDQYDEEDPTVPWFDDFKVTGSILAPRCSTDTSPIPGDTNTPPTDGGDSGNGDDTDTPTPTDCKKGKGKATGHEIGVGHETSNGKHLGHEHNCE